MGTCVRFLVFSGDPCFEYHALYEKKKELSISEPERYCWILFGWSLLEHMLPNISCETAHTCTLPKYIQKLDEHSQRRYRERQLASLHLQEEQQLAQQLAQAITTKMLNYFPHLGMVLSPR